MSGKKKNKWIREKLGVPRSEPIEGRADILVRPDRAPPSTINVMAGWKTRPPLMGLEVLFARTESLRSFLELQRQDFMFLSNGLNRVIDDVAHP